MLIMRLVLLISLSGAAQAEPVDSVGPLSNIAPNGDMGRQAFVSRDQGHCILCHRIKGLEVPFQGDLGPDLSDVGARLNPGQIRYRIVDASQLNPETVMPPYFRTHGLNQVAESHQGESILSAETIEHLVEYLSERVSTD